MNNEEIRFWEMVLIASLAGTASSSVGNSTVVDRAERIANDAVAARRKAYLGQAEGADVDTTEIVRKRAKMPAKVHVPGPNVEVLGQGGPKG